MPSLADLIRMGKQYIGDAMPGGALNQEVTGQSVLDGVATALTPVPLVGDVAGLAADAYRYKTDPESRTPLNFGLSALGALPFIPSMTAWHASPYKFDKFDFSKIGSGEGAQAYGHGGYLAENQQVAKEYLKLAGKENGPAGQTASNALKMYKTPDAAIESLSDGLTPNLTPEARKLTEEAISLLQAGKANTGYMYKTDIPDEAVARFLDWDKPLSQQAPEVRGAVIRAAKSSSDPWISGWGKTWEEYPSATGSEVYKSISNRLGNQNKLAFDSSPEVPDTSAMLRAAGIPGIRYLDGGSRSAGQGSSNFVAFDPEMIRILERNGQATGLEPWKPGEYRLKDLIGKE